MRVLRLIIISFIVFFLLATGFSLLIPSHIRISKAINIKASRDSVLAPVKNPARWKEWYPGFDTLRLFYDQGVAKGVVLNDKDPAHPISMVITRSEPYEVEAQLRGSKLKPVVNVWKTIAYPSGDSITLQWYMDFHLRWYPWEKFASLLLEKSNGPRMEKGLSTLKKNLGN